jgi:hypothetical protein
MTPRDAERPAYFSVLSFAAALGLLLWWMT